MKLRIKESTLRLRISRPEMALLIGDGRLEETIRFGASADAKLSYVLTHAESGPDICMEYRDQTVTIVLASDAARRWAQGDEVGIYGDSDTGAGMVTLMVEKDFACLDGDDPYDPDAFPNPGAGTVC